jgi:hypothetical protein
VQPWRQDVVFGAVQQGDGLQLSLRAGSDWTGVLRFDAPRHRTHMGLPVDWPRMNQFPEWFTVNGGARYEVRDLSASTVAIHTGADLQRGLPLRLAADRETRVLVRAVGPR